MDGLPGYLNRALLESTPAASYNENNLPELPEYHELILTNLLNAQEYGNTITNFTNKITANTLNQQVTDIALTRIAFVPKIPEPPLFPATKERILFTYAPSFHGWVSLLTNNTLLTNAHEQLKWMFIQSWEHEIDGLEEGLTKEVYETVEELNADLQQIAGTALLTKWANAEYKNPITNISARNTLWRTNAAPPGTNWDRTLNAHGDDTDLIHNVVFNDNATYGVMTIPAPAGGVADTVTGHYVPFAMDINSASSTMEIPLGAETRIAPESQIVATAWVAGRNGGPNTKIGDLKITAQAVSFFETKLFTFGSSSPFTSGGDGWVIDGETVVASFENRVNLASAMIGSFEPVPIPPLAPKEVSYPKFIKTSSQKFCNKRTVAASPYARPSAPGAPGDLIPNASAVLQILCDKIELNYLVAGQPTHTLKTVFLEDVTTDKMVVIAIPYEQIEWKSLIDQTNSTLNIVLCDATGAEHEKLKELEGLVDVYVTVKPRFNPRNSKVNAYL